MCVCMRARASVCVCAEGEECEAHNEFVCYELYLKRCNMKHDEK